MLCVFHGYCEAAPAHLCHLCRVLQGSIPKAAQGWRIRGEAFAQSRFRLACRSRPRQNRDFSQLSSLSCCPCQCSNCNKVKTDGWEGGGAVSSSSPRQHLKDTSESHDLLQLNQHSLLIWLRLKIAIPVASPAHSGLRLCGAIWGWMERGLES